MPDTGTNSNQEGISIVMKSLNTVKETRKANETNTSKARKQILAVKTDLKAGAAGDPCEQIWYDGYYKGYQDAFGVVYY
jgi:hypothetical protein